MKTDTVTASFFDVPSLPQKGRFRLFFFIICLLLNQLSEWQMVPKMIVECDC